MRQPPEVSDWARAAAERLIRLIAPMVVEALEFVQALNLEPNHPCAEQVKSADFLLELGVVLTLSKWEAAGLTPYLGRFPRAAEAISELFGREGGNAADDGRQLLFHRLLRFWLFNFSHFELVRPDQPMLLVGSAADHLLEELAEFLWQFRHLASTSE